MALSTDVKPQLEAVVQPYVGKINYDQLLMTSIAISLKRMADTMEAEISFSDEASQT